MLEKEYKTILSKKQYAQLIETFEKEKQYLQINFYYKKEGSNEDLELTIRIRVKMGKMLLQVKEPISKEDGIHIKREYEKEIKTIPYIISGEELNALCHSEKYTDSYLLGMLVTERRISIIDNCELALDINHYCGITDYELEIEYIDKLSPKLIDLLKEMNIYKSENGDGKFKRFYTRYSEMEMKNNG